MTDFSREWSQLGYPVQMGSARFLPPPDTTVVRAYHFVAYEDAKSNIEKQRLKVSRFSEVNDPFELIALNLRKADVRQAIRANKALADKNTGFLCFCRNWTNPLLWSHYADKHRGVCLGFDLSPDDLVLVEYISELPKIDAADLESNTSVSPELRERLMKTKYDGWKYEEEIRRFVELSKDNQDGDHYFLPFDERLRLKEVILGARADSMASLKSLVHASSPDATVFKARAEWSDFRIIWDGNTRPELEHAADLVTNANNE